jgi:protein ImuB
VTLRDKRPESFLFQEKRYDVEQAYGPWLQSGDWWNPTLWDHQQWDLIARSHDGSLLCCCLTHELRQGSWQMVGRYD